jgi:hypothetical protein
MTSWVREPWLQHDMIYFNLTSINTKVNSLLEIKRPILIMCFLYVSFTAHSLVGRSSIGMCNLIEVTCSYCFCTRIQ